MAEPVSDRAAMVAGMRPRLEAAPFRFVAQSADAEGAASHNGFAVIQEEEGTTFILKSSEADAGGHTGLDFARITLEVHSALEGVGLTAAVATALADEQIACNVVAGFYHDHLFVPWDRREDAMLVLAKLSEAARS